MKTLAGPYYEFRPFRQIPQAHFVTLSQRDLLTRDKSGEFRFTESGVFSTENAIYVVLPWVLEALDGSVTDPSSPLAAGFNRLNWFRSLAEAGLGNRTGVNSGNEFVLAAMFMGMNELIDEGLRYNVFREEVSTLHVVRGKWHIEKDLSVGEFPTRFTCTTDECDRKHPILAIALAFATSFSDSVQSPELSWSAEVLIRKLSPLVEYPKNIEETLEDAIALSESDSRFSNWEAWLVGLKYLCEKLGAFDRLSDVGLIEDFRFETAQFFEDAVSLILTACGFTSKKQQSGKILGGAYWGGADGPLEEKFQAAGARQTSRPDLIVTQDGRNNLLVECKYKRLKACRFSEKGNEHLRINGLHREDRNQLLSFILSASDDLRFRPTAIVLTYPVFDNDPSADLIPTLTFRAVQSYSDKETNLRWGKLESGDAVTVYFVGIRVIAALRAVAHRELVSEEIKRLKSVFEALLRK